MRKKHETANTELVPSNLNGPIFLSNDIKEIYKKAILVAKTSIFHTKTRSLPHPVPHIMKKAKKKQNVRLRLRPRLRY